MKLLYALLFLSIFTKASAQDVIYSVSGEKTPAKAVAILADKIKYKNPDNLTGPDYSRSFSKVLIAFNASGDFLVFNDKFNATEDEKNAFINAAPAQRSADIVVDVNGGVSTMDVKSEKDTYLSIMLKGKEKKIAKSLLVCIIRKKGTHQLFTDPDKAADLLTSAKGKLYQLLNISSGAKTDQAPVTAVATQAAAKTTATATPATPAAPAATNSDLELAVDKEAFSKKAEKKLDDFKKYVNTICQSSTDRETANKSIDLACGLFASEDAQVEVSSVNSADKAKYKIRVYLGRLQHLGKQYESVSVKYANVNYASRFTKGADGNWHAIVTFVQTFEGFIDGKVVYGDRTKRNLEIIVKKYDKSIDGEVLSGWDVFFEDMGVIQTKKA